MAPRTTYPGDAHLPTATMIYNQQITIPSHPPSDVFPWLLQLGCGRAGWYLPITLEDWVIPTSIRASRTIKREWTQLEVGDVVDDYRMPVVDREVPRFEVVDVYGNGAGGGAEWEDGADRNSEGEMYLVYRSERYGAVFTWTLMARPISIGEGQAGTEVHLRFRGRIAATGLKARLIIWAGGVMDYITTAPMLWGLRDRVLAQGKEHGE